MKRTVVVVLALFAFVCAAPLFAVAAEFKLVIPLPLGFKDSTGKPEIARSIVEQNVRQIRAIADRAYVLETGKVQMEGTGKDLLNDPHVKAAYLGL